MCVACLYKVQPLRIAWSCVSTHSALSLLFNFFVSSWLTYFSCSVFVFWLSSPTVALHRQQFFYPPAHVRHRLATDLHRALDDALLKVVPAAHRPIARAFGPLPGTLPYSATLPSSSSSSASSSAALSSSASGSSKQSSSTSSLSSSSSSVALSSALASATALGLYAEPLATVSCNFLHIAMLNADENCGASMAIGAFGGDDNDAGGSASSSSHSSHSSSSSAAAAALDMPGIGAGSRYHGNNKNFPLLDAVCRRLGRRAGRLPEWYPAAWKRNIRKSFRFVAQTPMETEQ